MLFRSDEMMKLRAAIDGSRTYEIPERHDPLYLMFDNDFHLGKLTPIGGSLHSPSYITIIYFHISMIFKFLLLLQFFDCTIYFTFNFIFNERM